MSEFFAMGGHGFYIWASYGVTALFMIIEVIAVIRGKRTVEKRLARLARAARTA
ncbi:MAG TPA: heme exporter protein CcmD [Chromatiales bacterium]|nr:heme exporter protein CcmD [Chromatiales bacterium]HEX22736.1 heme exporter protein CcmD [Chromatiales bacterium]